VNMNSGRILLIDAMNMYIRNYVCNPSITLHGRPVGGLKGFLASMAKSIRMTNPQKIFIVWDGAGGSIRRKSQNKNYKSGRTPIRLNRELKISPNDELKNKIWQQENLIMYLKLLPVVQISIEGLEADDVIAQICFDQSHLQKVIVSNDKDFYQLCDRTTVVYRPTPDKLINTNRVIEEHGVHPLNFSLARAICGDKSDNLKGVPRVGLKTLTKRLSIFSSSDNITFDKLYRECRIKESSSKVKIFKDILENKKIIEENYRIMQLYVPSMSMPSVAKIREAIMEDDWYLNKNEIYRMVSRHGIEGFDWDSLFSLFRRVLDSRKEV